MRKRAQRDRQRAAALTTPTPAGPSIGQPQAVTPGPGAVGVTSPASGVTQDAPRDVPRVSLLETEIVQGPGAGAFVAPSAIGGDETGAGATPIVEAAPPPPPRTTTPEEAALIGAAYAKFCGFGWGMLATRHQEALAAMMPPAIQAQMFTGGLTMVEKSATTLALKHNVRIPYSDELVVGLGGALAAVGVVGEIKSAKNDNAPTKSKKAAGGGQSPAASNRPSSPRDIVDAELVDQDDKDDGSPIARPVSQAAAEDADEVVLG